MSEPRSPFLISLYSQEAKAANNKERDRLVWVQTRAQQGEPASTMKLPERKRKHAESHGSKENDGVWETRSRFFC